MSYTLNIHTGNGDYLETVWYSPESADSLRPALVSWLDANHPGWHQVVVIPHVTKFMMLRRVGDA